jgi:succinate dehydrogenase / fumarate reductase membrane anchor subunit
MSMPASLLKWTKGGLKNPMSRAHNLGSAHAGVHHWIMQRITAVALIPLTLWLCWSLVSIVHMDLAYLFLWLQKPLNTILLILSVVTMFYHAALGCQVVIEDYIHSEWFKIVKLVSMKIVLFTACISCIYAILKVALS